MLADSITVIKTIYLFTIKLPFLIILFYHFLKESPLYGSIQQGDTVTSLYGCQVYNKEDWNECISKTLSSPQHGYCTDMLTVTRKNSSQGWYMHVV